MAADGRALLLAPRRLGEVDGRTLGARYFPGIEVEIGALDFEELFGALEGEGFEALPSGAYSTVVVVESLEHSREPARVLRAAAHALEEGGALLVSVPFSLPLHEAGSDYWRVTPDGLRALLEGAGFEAVKVFDTGEEVVWDVIPGSPGLVETWMPCPRTCFATARKGAGTVREAGGDPGGEALKELLATDVAIMREKAEDLLACLEASEEQVMKYQARIRHLEEDSEPKRVEMDKVSEWARGMEAQLLALQGPESASDPETPPPEGGSGRGKRPGRRRKNA